MTTDGVPSSLTDQKLGVRHPSRWHRPRRNVPGGLDRCPFSSCRCSQQVRTMQFLITFAEIHDLGRRLAQTFPDLICKIQPAHVDCCNPPAQTFHITSAGALVEICWISSEKMVHVLADRSLRYSGQYRLVKRQYPDSVRSTKMCVPGPSIQSRS